MFRTHELVNNLVQVLEEVNCDSDLPLSLIRSYVLLHVLRQLEEFEEGCGMEQIVSGLPENHGEFLIVVGHGFWYWRLLRQVHQTVNVLDSLVGFLKCKNIT